MSNLRLLHSVVYVLRMNKSRIVKTFQRLNTSYSDKIVALQIVTIIQFYETLH